MSFLPLFCPNPDCAHHQRRTPLLPGEKPWFHRKSHFNITRNDWVPRFRCGGCGRKKRREGQPRSGTGFEGAIAAARQTGLK